MANVSHPHVFTPTRQTGCQGYSVGTGNQCGRDWINGPYCQDHQTQESNCRAKRRDGRRCTLPIHPEGRGYFCSDYHLEWATPTELVCGGTITNGDPCFGRVTRVGQTLCELHRNDPVAHQRGAAPALGGTGNVQGRGPARVLTPDDSDDSDDNLERMVVSFSCLELNNSEAEVSAAVRDEHTAIQIKKLAAADISTGKALTAFLNAVLEACALEDVRAAAAKLANRLQEKDLRG